jgi:hypothetical protein
MTSERKITANRINGRKSRGPRTAAGKARASRNAFRHGLAALTENNPVLLPEIEQMAKRICGCDRNPLLYEQAIIIAENELALRCVRLERIAVIERLRDGTAIAISKGDNSIALAKARHRESELAWEEIVRIKTRFGVTTDGLPIFIPGLEDQPAQLGWRPSPPEERDEIDALREAMPDLERLARYERRAWSRRKRAIREFVEIKSSNCAARDLHNGARLVGAVSAAN